jgi:hypothetical protein
MNDDVGVWNALCQCCFQAPNPFGTTLHRHRIASSIRPWGSRFHDRRSFAPCTAEICKRAHRSLVYPWERLNEVRCRLKGDVVQDRVVGSIYRNWGTCVRPILRKHTSEGYAWSRCAFRISASCGVVPIARRSRTEGPNSICQPGPAPRMKTPRHFSNSSLPPFYPFPLHFPAPPAPSCLRPRQAPLTPYRAPRFSQNRY